MAGLGEDLNREGLKKMPLRVAKRPPRRNKGKMEHFFFFTGRWNSLNVISVILFAICVFVL
ncbi:hypothetical protein ACE6H2_010482 [Prunus campanulata]